MKALLLIMSITLIATLPIGFLMILATLLLQGNFVSAYPHNSDLAKLGILSFEEQRQLWKNWYSITQNQYLTEQEAAQAINNSTEVPFRWTLQFGFLDYDAKESDADHYHFAFYAADPKTKTLISYQPILTFDLHKDQNKGNGYYASELKDRYVWKILIPSIPSEGHTFVDAVTGERIGHWSDCPFCVCHHNNNE
jgi:hypothetical protein